MSCATAMRTAQSRARAVFSSLPAFFFGYAFLRAWVLIEASAAQTAELWGGLGGGTLFDLSALLCAATLVALSQRIAPLYARPAGRATACLLLVAASAALPFANGPAGHLATAVYATAGGAGFVASLLCWYEFVVSFNPVKAVVVYTCARLAGDALAWLLAGCAAPQHLVAALLLPLASYACLARCSAWAARTAALPARSVTHPLPLKPTLTASLYAVAFSFAGVSLNLSCGVTDPARLLWVAFGLAVIGGITLRARRITAAGLFKLTVYTMLACSAVMLLGSWLPPAAARGAYGLGDYCTNLFGLIVLGQLSFRLSVSPLWLFGISRVFDYAGMFLGSATLFGIRTAGVEPYPNLVAAACIVLVAVLSVVALTERGVFSNWSIENVVERGERTPAVSATGLRELYGLTQREEEVLCLLLREKTLSAIASELFVAPGTVKAHVQHIYQKMGVHTRKELLDAAGVRTDGSPS